MDGGNGRSERKWSRRYTGSERAAVEGGNEMRQLGVLIFTEYGRSVTQNEMLTQNEGEKEGGGEVGKREMEREREGEIERQGFKPSSRPAFPN
ncbi:hypothetical protein JZ751_006764 [Albula glossodonta]|uniref:Uncharacterized protein n=1 Tax=Albula glossodonta TaxID=121402 RepID=A0A8T2NZC3_9TELE|nr:hypothetical protein JZ751_006764 [Albula glossodonta]